MGSTRTARALFMVCALLAFLGARAQPPVDYLARFARSVGDYKTLKASLKLTVSDRKSKFQQVLDGTLETRGSSYCFQTGELEVWCDGETVWQYMPVVREVTVTEADGGGMSLFDHIMELFTSYDSLYRVSYQGARKERGRRDYLYHLYPKGYAAHTQIHVQFSGRDGMPSRLFYQGRDGVDYSVELLRVETGVSVRESFRFEVPAKKRVKVIDLRGE